jgi:signal peptidase I
MKKSKSKLSENIGMLLEVLVVVFFANAFLVQAFAIPTSSMETTMLIGDHILVDRVAYSRSLSPVDGLLLPQVKISRGMKLAFKSPPEIKAGNLARLYYVKRIIGLPGEVLKVVDNQVYIDGRPIEEPYKNLSAPPAVSPNFPPETEFGWPAEFPKEYRACVVDTPMGKGFKIPEKHYFCMGDNRNVSADSRIWGPLPADCIVGKPWRAYWSTDVSTEDMLGKNVLVRAKDFVTGVFTKTRWNRILMKY